MDVLLAGELKGVGAGGLNVCVQHIAAGWIFEMSGHLLGLYAAHPHSLRCWPALHCKHVLFIPRMYTGAVHLTLSTFCKHMH